ncbi:hypothetical protein EV674_13323 [Simplicispira metamorpha]|uniref:Uncharacterized protein n=1 Tax=Simplicispira metamorpha TaxID=80881 RepID=A0A4R2N1Z5_9BURK|nr:hypothetical protein EV674_13323 [Simplicispira metamorpha]
MQTTHLLCCNTQDQADPCTIRADFYSHHTLVRPHRDRRQYTRRHPQTSLRYNAALL